MNDVIIQDINFELLQAIEFYYCNIFDYKDLMNIFNNINKKYKIQMCKKSYLIDNTFRYYYIGNFNKQNIYKLEIILKGGDEFWN